MEDIHYILEVIANTNKRSMLATIIHVEGSAYRKAGSSMLFLEDGTQIGMLGAGCLETDLAACMNEIFADGHSRTVIFDMRDEEDLSWGQGAGCNGVIHVLLEPIEQRLREHMSMMKLYLDSRVPVVAAKKLNGDFSVSDYVFMTEDEHTFGDWRGDFLLKTKQIITNQDMVLQKRGVLYIREMSGYIYIQTYWPKSRLIIFGAGPDARPLAGFAARTGFSVTVCDWRPALNNIIHFPDADIRLIGFPAEFEDQLTLTPDDCVIVMTHHFRRDKELLQWVMKTQLRYLGILGPRQRTSRLFEGAGIPPWINSPAGLPIGAEGPEEIAVSIVAELVNIRRKPSVEKVVR